MKPQKFTIFRIFTSFSISAVLLVAAVFGILFGIKYGFNYTYTKMENIREYRNSPNIHSVELTITETTTLEGLADTLLEHEIILDKQWFIYENKLLSNKKDFIPGTYQLTSSMSHTQIVDLICSEEPVDPIKLTIPEGFTIEQIALRVDGTGVVTEDEFLDAVATHNYDYPFLEDIPDGVKYPLEGYLFPDTYFIYPTDSADDIIIRMLTQFGKVIDQYSTYLHSSDYTLHEIITIASIIEQEARLAEERPIISGVVYNRLEVGMPLQMCSTIQYALGVRKSSLTYEDLAIESPYNTYLASDLPVGPISSVSEDSIRAALMPETHEYYYFVLKDSTTGAHAFSSTGEQHVANKNRYLQTDDKNFLD